MMLVRNLAAFVAALALANVGSAVPTESLNDLQARAAPDNTVRINSADDYCLILPRAKYSTIGDSEHPGGMRSYCTKRNSDSQGKIPAGFFTAGPYISRKAGRSGQRQIQMTGCINASRSPRLVPSDGGGHGGAGGRGNPAGSVCTGYKHYVELIEPDANRACLRCCDNYNDCALQFDTAGCKKVIPGKYPGC